MNFLLFLISLLFAGNHVSADFGMNQVIYKPASNTSDFIFPNTL
jgi:hypothetical protein